MKVPFSWLKELVDIDVTAQELEEKLFSCGFEVEELIPLDAGSSASYDTSPPDLRTGNRGDRRGQCQGAVQIF